jgi:hypothetical protein
VLVRARARCKAFGVGLVHDWLVVSAQGVFVANAMVQNDAGRAQRPPSLLQHVGWGRRWTAVAAASLVHLSA